ncbi:hypothetical protein KSS87_009502, partial [Heliosperma pusillum]
GWKLYDLETESFFVSCDVVFHEQSFPFVSLVSPPVPSSSPYLETYPGLEDDHVETHTNPGTPPIIESGGNGDVSCDPIDGVATEGGSLSVPSSAEEAPSSPTKVSTTTDLVLSRGQRLKFPNTRLRGYALDTAQSPSPPSSSPGSPTLSSARVLFRGSMESYNLRSVLELPPIFRSTFNFRYFNSLQSECFPTCFLSDVNMVISAPTGSGKTVLFELCILRLLSRSLAADGRFAHVNGTLKTIYIAPSKALVQEKLRDWSQKLGAWGISCLEMTGDNDSYNFRNVQEADIILTTPEKFDAVTRFRIRDGGLSYFSDIGLLLIDEVHLLNDPRGAALEAIVSRIKMISCRPEMKSNTLAHVRFIAVSATIPNLEDLADWLMVPPEGMKRFGEEMRPVKLTTKVFGYAAAKNDFLFEKRLQNYIFDILMQYSRGKSSLVFCSTRKGTQEAAQKISQTAMTFGYSNPFIKTTEQLERLRDASLSCSDKQLQSYILYGVILSDPAMHSNPTVGFHNGGLSLKDRNLVESLFLGGDIQVICTTNTLAHGVNLPAHTVVIKSTQNYNKEKSGYTEYDRSTVLQMCGRAGRPPFDDTGLVIIMTRKETIAFMYDGASNCRNRPAYGPRHHTGNRMDEVLIPNPETYSVKKGISKDRIERHMQDICVKKVNELSSNQMIWTDEDGFLLKPLEPGRLMTKYYLKFDTMKHIMQAQSNCSLEEALHTICRAEELSWIQLRRNEKRLLNDINADKNGRLRFHVLGDKGKKKKRIQSREEKIFVLANDCFTGDPLIHDLSLTQDMNSICSNGCRVARCMKEYFIFRKNYKGTLNSIILAKSLHHKLWDESPFLLKQLPGIGMVTAKALHSIGITTFDKLADADPRRIEIVAGRKFPFGDHIKESLLSLPPKVEMKLEATENQRQGKPKLAITLTRLTQAQSSKRHYADLVVGLEEENAITYHEKIRIDDFLSPYHTTVLLPNHQQGKLVVKTDLIFEEYKLQATCVNHAVGVDLHQKIELTEEIKSKETARLDSKKLSSSEHPEEIWSPVKKGNNVNTTPFKKQPKNRANEEIDDMPSFKLIDDELEGVQPNQADDDECQIISVNKIFDHIRKKAKDFPMITTSGPIQFPVLKPPIPPRVQICAEQVTDHCNSEREYSEHLDNQDAEEHGIASTSQHTSDLVNNGLLESTDLSHSRVAAKRKDNEMMDQIFDQVRKRSKNSPVIIKPGSFGSLAQSQNHYSVKEPQLSHMSGIKTEERHSGRPLLLSTVIEQKKSLLVETVKEKRHLPSSRTLDLPFEVLHNHQFNKVCNDKIAPDSSSLRKNIRFEPPGNSVGPQGRNPTNQLTEVMRGSCSLQTETGNKNVDSFLGYKSVFSFL